MKTPSFAIVTLLAVLSVPAFGQSASGNNGQGHTPGSAGQATGNGNNNAGSTAAAAANATLGPSGNVTVTPTVPTAPGGGPGNGNGNGASHGPGGDHGAAATPQPHAPNPHASDKSNAVQAVLQTFDASRDRVVAARQALIDQLAAATSDSERATILAQLRDEQQSVRDEQKAVAKEIRAELQSLRRQRAGGG